MDSFDASLDGRTVVYRADQEVDGRFDLYGVPADGSAYPVRLATCACLGYRIDPEGRRVVYLVDPEGDGYLQLFSVPADGSASPLLIAQATVPGVYFASGFEINSLGTHVVFLTVQREDACLQLYRLVSVPIDGRSSAVRLNRFLEGRCIEEDQDDFQFQLSPDGLSVAYVADEDADKVYELYSVPIDGGRSAVRHARRLPARPLKLNGPLPPGGDVGVHGEDSHWGSSFAISADGTQVVYRASQDTAFQVELYTVPLDGSAPSRKLNPPLALGPSPGDVVSFSLSADGERVVYRADQEVDERFELYAAPAEPGAEPVKLSPPLVPGGDVVLQRLGQDARTAVYVADQTQDGVLELFSVPVDGSAPAVQLNPPLVAGGTVSYFGDYDGFQLSPDGSLAVYYAEQDRNNIIELYSVPLDASAPAVKLNAPLVPGSDVSPRARITGDGARVVYRASQEAVGVFELYSVPIDAGSPPVKLNGPMVAGGDVAFPGESIFVSPDGERVLYIADQTTDEVYELFSAPSDGSSAPVKLNGTLAGELSRVPGSVQLGPDSARAVYRASQETFGVFELYSVSTDGSGGPIVLNGALVQGGDVDPGFQITADSARVVYVADETVDGRSDLHSVPLDGSASAILLAANVDGFDLAPDGDFALFVRGGELHVVAVDGSSSPVEVAAPGDVSGFLIAPGSEHVITYVPRWGSDLYWLPIHGSSPPQPLSGPLDVSGGASGGTRSFQIRPDRRAVVYLADQDERSVVELYAAPLGPPPRRADTPAGD